LAAERLVREAEHYIDQNINRPIHITEVTQHLDDVPRRTLFHAFKNVLGVSPHAYIQRRRLGAVHEVLRQGGHDPDELIRTVAREHGFLDLGKFAKAYRRLFGERPSETLRHGRAHGIRDWKRS
jgi:AraC family ethanolamine operon transcriptional activator